MGIVIMPLVVVVANRLVVVVSVEFVTVKSNTPESNAPSERVAFFTMVSDAGVF